jgi:Ca2+-binding RTX toxin-like protein
MSGVSTILGTGNDSWPGPGVDNTGNDSVDGSLGSDTINGGAGNDTILGGVGNPADINLLIGGIGDDSIVAGDFFAFDEREENLLGGEGNDTLVAGNGNQNQLNGGTDNDSLLATGGRDDLLFGGDGNDTVRGGDNVNTSLRGGNDDDLILAGAASTSELHNLFGDDGHDTLIASIANNQFLSGGTGNDSLQGGSGNNHEYRGGAGNDTLVAGGGGGQLLVGDSEVDPLATGDDSLFGAGAAESLLGQLGNDTLDGGADNDTLDGGNGNDFASYAAATDTVRAFLSDDTNPGVGEASDGSDQLFGIEGLIGGNFNDELTGNSSANTLYGGGGSDVMVGGGGGDWLDFGAGSDSYTYLIGDTALRGNQTLIGDGDNIFGNGIGNDTLDLGVGWSSGQPASGWINYQHVAGGVTTNLWTQGWEQVVCFAEGTRIVTPGGEDVVENLRAGDMVLAMRNGQAGFEPLRWVGFMDIAVPRNAVMAAKTAPILIKAGAIAPGMPARDLRVSPDHAMEIDGHLIPAKHLVNGSSIIQEIWCKRVRYFHLELEAHGLLLSEGTWSESYLDDGNRHAFNNAALTGLFLDFEGGRSNGEYDHMACLPVLRQGLKLDEIHGRLALRATEFARAEKGRAQG